MQLILSDNIHARSFASLIHRLVRFSSHRLSPILLLGYASPFSKLVHFYNINYVDITYTQGWKIPLCRHTRTQDWENYVDIIEYVYLFRYLSFYFVSYGSVDIALMNLRHCRSVWGSLLHTYPQSVLYLSCRRRTITKCTVLQKDNPCCGNS